MQGSNLLYVTCFFVGDKSNLGLFISPTSILLSIIFLFLFSTFIEASQSQGVRVNLTSDKARYIPGESITVSVRVVNPDPTKK